MDGPAGLPQAVRGHALSLVQQFDGSLGIVLIIGVYIAVIVALVMMRTVELYQPPIVIRAMLIGSYP